MNNLLHSKTLFWTFINLIVIAVAVVIWKVLLFGLPVVPEMRTITVSAEGKTVVAPDIAKISFSVVTEGQNPGTIQEENTKKMNDAIAFIKEQGISEADIKTTDYSLNPRYDYSRPRPIGDPEGGSNPYILGYALSQTVTIKVRDLEKIAPILAGLPSKGINQITSVGFDVDDPEIYLNQAREEAFKKAYEKARIMAKQNNTRIKRVVTFTESQGGFPPIYYAKAENSLDGGLGGAMPPTIEPGTQDVTINVMVTYEIR